MPTLQGIFPTKRSKIITLYLCLKGSVNLSHDKNSNSREGSSSGKKIYLNQYN